MIEGLMLKLHYIQFLIEKIHLKEHSGYTNQIDVRCGTNSPYQNEKDSNDSENEVVEDLKNSEE